VALLLQCLLKQSALTRGNFLLTVPPCVCRREEKQSAAVQKQAAAQAEELAQFAANHAE
jgi:hypothetical protein